MPNEHTFKTGTTLELDDTSRPSGSRVRIRLDRSGQWIMEASFSRPELPKREHRILKYADIRERDRAREKEVEGMMSKFRKK